MFLWKISCRSFSNDSEISTSSSYSISYFKGNLFWHAHQSTPWSGDSVSTFTGVDFLRHLTVTNSADQLVNSSTRTADRSCHAEWKSQLKISSETDENCSGMLQEYWREMYISSEIYLSECYYLQSFQDQFGQFYGAVKLLGRMYRQPYKWLFAKKST